MVTSHASLAALCGTQPKHWPIRAQDRPLLEALVRGRNTPQKVALRARIVLAAAEGQSNHRLAKELNTSRPTILLWRQRYAQAGPSGLLKMRLALVGGSRLERRRWKRS